MTQGVPGIEFVSSYADVIANVGQFNQDLRDGTYLIDQLSQFRHWYYIPSLDMFGPSKYIGYKDMNAGRYNVGHRSPEQKLAGIRPKDGRETLEEMKRWFSIVKDEAILQLLKSKLEDMLSAYGKKPNKLHRIHLPVTQKNHSNYEYVGSDVFTGSQQDMPIRSGSKQASTGLTETPVHNSDNAESKTVLPRVLVEAFVALQEKYGEPLFKQVVELYEGNPDIVLVKARILLERMLKARYLEVFGRDYYGRLDDLIREFQLKGSIPKRITNHMHNVRTLGNVAVHEGTVDKFTQAEALGVLQSLWIIADGLKK